jgi:hypothetical protein
MNMAAMSGASGGFFAFYFEPVLVAGGVLVPALAD